MHNKLWQHLSEKYSFKVNSKYENNNVNYKIFALEMFYDINLFLILLFLMSIWKASYLETNFTAIMYGIKDNWVFVKPQNCNVDIFLISDKWNEALITLYKLIGNHDNPQTFSKITMNFVKLTASDHLVITLAALFLM